jgi:hypothetical protein
MVCVTLSDQIKVNGAVPVSAALTVAEPPGQIDPPPLTAAAGRGRTLTAVGAEAALHPAAFVTVTL